MLGLTQPCTRLDYLPPRASLITSSLDHPRKTKKVSVYRSKKEVSAKSTNEVVTVPDAKQIIPKLVTSKEQTLQSYPDAFEGIGCFPGPSCHIQIDQSITPKHTPCRPVLVHLKDTFQQEIDKMLKVEVLKPVHEVTPWINSFVLVEGKEKLGNLKLRICLDPIKLNKAIMREPYHFKTLEDIAHLLADASCKPNTNKVTAITKMPAPTNKKQVQSFKGMVNYLPKFSARLSEIVESIRNLAKDKVPFNWAQNVNLLLHR